MTEALQVIIVCENESSGYEMGENLKQEIDRKGLDITVSMESNSERLKERMGNAQILMVCPKCARLVGDISKDSSIHGTTVVLMNAEYYSRRDGEMALAHLLKVAGSCGRGSEQKSEVNHEGI